MCAPVQFQYRCGCAEHVRFECGGAHRARHAERPAVVTRLGEDCHDCHAAPLLPAEMFRLALAAGGDGGRIASPRAALRELDVNTPAAAPPAVVSSSSSAAASFESSASSGSSISTES